MTWTANTWTILTLDSNSLSTHSSQNSKQLAYEQLVEHWRIGGSALRSSKPKETQKTLSMIIWTAVLKKIGMVPSPDKKELRKIKATYCIYSYTHSWLASCPVLDFYASLASLPFTWPGFVDSMLNICWFHLSWLHPLSDLLQLQLLQT